MNPNVKPTQFGRSVIFWELIKIRYFEPITFKFDILQAHSNYKAERHLIGGWFCQLGNLMTLPTIPFLTVSSQSVPSQTVTSLSATSEPVTSSNSPDVEPIKPVEPEKHLKNLKPVEPVEIRFQTWLLYT